MSKDTELTDGYTVLCFVFSFPLLKMVHFYAAHSVLQIPHRFKCSLRHS